MVEAALAIFLNGIGTAIHKICKNNSKADVPSKPRRWYRSTRTKPLPVGHPPHESPTSTSLKRERPFMDHRQGDRRTHVQHRIKHQQHNENQLTNGAYMVFSSQDERRFHIGVSFCQTEVRVYVFDRAGVIGSVKFDLQKEPKC
ncbi:hypothetical protein BDZ97DRAFT_1387901 [Flammula alnicola]|nr:hypothetical protein BDZ97DRAFT_1387901 [Flammula alnicola]